MKRKIFISTPIAGFGNEKDYLEYKKVLEKICISLQKEIGQENIYSAFLEVSDFNDYDLPEKSAKKDIKNIKNAEFFILFYPKRMITSALTELGIALGMNKKILIVAPDKKILPFMVQGMPFLETYNVKFLKKDIADDSILEDLLKFLNC